MIASSPASASNASMALLNKVGGRQVVWLLDLATVALILGAPLATLLIERFDLQPRASTQAVAVAVTTVLEEDDSPADGLDV